MMCSIICLTSLMMWQLTELSCFDLYVADIRVALGKYSTFPVTHSVNWCSIIIARVENFPVLIGTAHTKKSKHITSEYTDW